MREFCPLECAIKQMKETNRKVEELLHKYIDVEAENLNDLQRTMQGIIAPAVMGGIKNYEDAFFNGEYVPDDDSHKDGRGCTGDIDELKQLIADQGPLMELGMRYVRWQIKLISLKKRNSVQFSENSVHFLKNPVLKILRSIQREFHFN